MPLIDPQAVKEIEIDGDKYTLRQQIGFYDQAQMKQAAFTFEFPPDWDSKKMSDVKAVPNTADRELAKLRAYLVSWSHDDELNDDNLKRLPPAHAERLLDEVKALEEAAPQPFRGKRKKA